MSVATYLSCKRACAHIPVMQPSECLYFSKGIRSTHFQVKLKWCLISNYLNYFSKLMPEGEKKLICRHLIKFINIVHLKDNSSNSEIIVFSNFFRIIDPQHSQTIRIKSLSYIQRSYTMKSFFKSLLSQKQWKFYFLVGNSRSVFQA